MAVDGGEYSSHRSWRGRAALSWTPSGWMRLLVPMIRSEGGSLWTTPMTNFVTESWQHQFRRDQSGRRRIRFVLFPASFGELLEQGGERHRLMDGG